ncbi:MAG: IgGFc-binding protein [Bradymonadaceae bacterium]|nr:IgGFc-binding protein [Lujinxingiaceae bacterium]
MIAWTPGLILVLAMLTSVTGCVDGPTPRDVFGSNPGSEPSPDASTTPTPDDPKDVLPALRPLCVADARRCPFENSPIFEQCTGDQANYKRGLCPEGTVCHEDGCFPFACTPHRDVCLGPTMAATCDVTGQGYTNARACDAASGLCRGGYCTDPCSSAAASGSYIGCEYYARELPNHSQRATAGIFAVVLANPSRQLDAIVRLTDSTGQPADFVRERRLVPTTALPDAQPATVKSRFLTADGPRIFPDDTDAIAVPPGAAAVFLLDLAALEDQSAFKVTSSRPVVAYQFNPYCCNFTASNDASLLLPAATWGTRYRVVNYPTMATPDEDLSSYVPYITVIAKQDQTTITVDSPVLLQEGVEADAALTFRQASFVLDAGQTRTLGAQSLKVHAADGSGMDLSGAVVTADAPVAVMVGHVCTFVPQDKWACDHLEAQMPPAATLGRNYVLSPARRRNAVSDIPTNEGIYWRLVADERSQLTFEPPLGELARLPHSTVATKNCHDLLGDDGLLELEAGEVCEFGTRSPVSLSSTGRIAVAGVLSGHQSTGLAGFGSKAGDPSMFILAPVEQLRREYAFVAPPTYAKTYVSVAMSADAPLLHNGKPVTIAQRLERRKLTHATQSWEVFAVALEPGVHAMESSEPFGIIVYSYDDYVSYAFTGGLNLLPKGAP